MDSAAFIRLLVIFGVTLGGGYVYESTALDRYKVGQGEVARVEPNRSGGPNADEKKFDIAYRVDDTEQQVTATRGIVGQTWTYRNLSRGDDVPILIPKDQPGDATIDAISRRYPFTLCVGALFVIFVGTLLCRPLIR